MKLLLNLQFQDKEVTNGGSAPRILSIDDYFMVENDIVIKDPDTGKTITKTVSLLMLTVILRHKEIMPITSID